MDSDKLSSSAPSGRPSHLALLMSAASSPESQENMAGHPAPTRSTSVVWPPQHRDLADTRSIRTDLSAQSAPVHANEFLSDKSSLGGPPSAPGSIVHRKRRSLLTPIGYLKISDPMMSEIIKYRRTIVIVALAFLYALFGMGAIIFRSNNSPPSRPRHLVAGSSEEWSQDVIAGWFRDRALSPVANLTGYPSSMRIRECRSRILQKQHQLALQQEHKIQQQEEKIAQLSGANSSSTPAPSESQQVGSNRSLELTSTRTPTSSTTSTTLVPILTRRRRKFEALNGCLFRREASSDSLGDLCCCAGPPRFVLLAEESDKQRSNQTGATQRPAKSNATASHSAGNLRYKRKYMRPQLICFASTSAVLFNINKQVAPIADELALRGTFAQGQSRCIVCSCCHEHEPEQVNRLLAGVPLHSTSQKARAKTLNHLVSSEFADSRQELSEYQGVGFWVRVRAKLVDWMRSMDRLFFWLFDLCEMSVLIARYGQPQDLDLADSQGLLLYQSVLARPPNLRAREQAHYATDAKAGLAGSEVPAASMMIDESLYDDFSTTSTTSTTSSTTSTTTSTTTNRPSGKSKKRAKTKRKHAKHRHPGDNSSWAEVNSTSTSKAPTVIINLHLLDKTKTELSSTTGRPDKPGLSELESGKTGNLEVRIQLATGDRQANETSDRAWSATSGLGLAAEQTNGSQSVGFGARSVLSPTGLNQIASGASTGGQASPPEAASSSSLHHRLKSEEAGNSTSPAIVISLDRGNSTTIIATINTTRLSAPVSTGAPRAPPELSRLSLIPQLPDSSSPAPTTSSPVSAADPGARISPEVSSQSVSGGVGEPDVVGAHLDAPKQVQFESGVAVQLEPSSAIRQAQTFEQQQASEQTMNLIQVTRTPHALVEEWPATLASAALPPLVV